MATMEDFSSHVAAVGDDDDDYDSILLLLGDIFGEPNLANELIELRTDDCIGCTFKCSGTVADDKRREFRRKRGDDIGTTAGVPNSSRRPD
ncbi:hypothetical protein BLOT_010315 [Blomia tropicalis]|nr:hypothetical protein BLOT_010315 [Blomia tropicalis]